MAEVEQNILEVLKRWWGYDSFRPGQREVIERVMAGRDTLALMPTGAGKSVCYQIPALMSKGVTIVVYHTETNSDSGDGTVIE